MNKQIKTIPIHGLLAGECLLYASSYSALVLRVYKRIHPTWGLIYEVLIQETPFKTGYLTYYPTSTIDIAI